MIINRTDLKKHIWLWYKSTNPLNCMVQVPVPPLEVTTMISPVPFPGPLRATILLGDFHSADSKQSQPHMVNPEKNICI